MGRGRRWRNRFFATGLPGWQRAASWPWPVASSPVYSSPFPVEVTREQQLDALKGQAEYFEDALEGIRRRIEELETKAKGS